MSTVGEKFLTAKSFMVFCLLITAYGARLNEREQKNAFLIGHLKNTPKQIIGNHVLEIRG